MRRFVRCVEIGAGLLKAALLCAVVGGLGGSYFGWFALEPAERSTDEWIADLSHPAEDVREQARQMLLLAGPSAVPALVTALDGADLPLTNRLMSVLEQKYRSTDEATYRAAEAALEEFSASRRGVVTALARTALARNHELRTERAILRIESLGGIVQFAEIDSESTIRASASLPPVESVTLGESWTGADAGAVHIRRIAMLNRLILIRGNELSRRAVDELLASCPRLGVTRLGQGYLGITGRHNRGEPPGFRVREVEPDSAAERSGMRPGDVVTQIDGDHTPSFQALARRLFDTNPGDSVTLSLYRNGKPVEVDVLLGADPKATF